MDIDKLEAGRELDALVAEIVFDHEWTHISPKRVWDDIPNYSTDISAAWLVVEKLEEIDPNAIIRVSNGDGDSCDVDILADAFSKVKSAHVSIEGELDDTPLAICRAALKAVESK